MSGTFVALCRPGPSWLADTPVWGQPLEEHGRYMHTAELRPWMSVDWPSYRV